MTSDPGDDTAAVERRWTALTARLGLRAGDAPLRELLALYGEPGRAYHNLRHLREVLAEVAGAPGDADEKDAVTLAAFFHDAVYDPRRGDNEEKSAELARDRLTGIGAAQTLADTVVRLVMATKHAVAPVREDEKLIVDADLAILGQGRERYEEYERAIREEYRHVPDEAFRLGRGKVLAAFLGRNRVYATDWFHDRYGTMARANLRWALDRLGV